MNAQELTKKKVNEQQSVIIDHEKRIKYLEQELEKLRMITDDLKEVINEMVDLEIRRDEGTAKKAISEHILPDDWMDIESDLLTPDQARAAVRELRKRFMGLREDEK